MTLARKPTIGCRVVTVTVVVLLGFLGSWPAALAEPLGHRVDLQSALDDAVRTLGVPGAAIRVTMNGISLERISGKDGDGRPFASSTPVLIGSVSKSFTAATVLALAEKGQIDLDRSAATYLPGFVSAEVTVTDLLRHTSGYDTTGGLRVADRFDTSPGALRRAAADVSRMRPGRPRGEYAYSDANYVLLGAIVEQVTGRDFAAVLQDLVIDGLGLRHSGAGAGLRRTPGHRSWWGTWHRFDAGYDDSGAPYGYVVSALDDLDRYAEAFQTGRGLSLSASSRALMTSRQADAGSDADGNAMWYGFGWRGGVLGGGAVVEHTGATPGFFTHVLWLPDRDVRIVVVANGYAQDRDERFASVARSLALAAAGETTPPTPGADPLLRWLPFGVVVVAAAGLFTAGWLVRRRRTLWLGILAAPVAVAAWFGAPLLTGLPAATLRLWVPDLGWSLVAAATTWSLVVIASLAIAGNRVVRRATRPAERPDRTDGERAPEFDGREMSPGR